MTQNKKPQEIFDITKLSESSIRKYQSYFQINCPQQQLKEKIKNHFNNDLKIQNNEIIEKFLQLKRQDKGIIKPVRPRNPVALPILR